MNDYEYAQAVMKAAGVDPLYRWVVGTHKVSCFSASSQDDCIRWKAQHFNYCIDNGYDICQRKIYPDPLKSGDGFLALWDALVARNYSVTVSHKAYGSAAVCVHAEGALARWQFHADRAVALVEAAGQELGVNRG